METGEVERSHTEYTVNSLPKIAKEQILSVANLSGIKVNLEELQDYNFNCPGFAISFNTVSDKGQRVSMSLKALFIPDKIVLNYENLTKIPTLPIASLIPESEEVIKGFYLRDEGYSETGAIAGRFTYIPTRQTLEMTTFYGQSVAVDQMRFIADDLRLRTIITYKRPSQLNQIPTEIKLVGFGTEKKM